MHITPTLMHSIESLLDAINTAASFELKKTLLRLKQDLSHHKMFEELGIKVVFRMADTANAQRGKGDEKKETAALFS
jgi:hypothetical protein